MDDDLKEKFKTLDKDNSGGVSASEVAALMIKQGKLEMGSKSADDFTAAMHNVITSEAWMNSDTNEISEEVFVKFWKNFYKLFYTLDRNKDQKVTVSEALDWFQKREKEKGLSRSNDMYQYVVDFMKQGDEDHAGYLSIVEFFVNLQGFKDIVKKFDKTGSQSN